MDDANLPNDDIHDLACETQEESDSTSRWRPSSVELEHIVQAHAEWAKSNGDKGQQADLEGANLRAANLQLAYLPEAKLQLADLHGADLRQATLSRANLQGARLNGANLSGTTLKGANIDDANLEEARLQDADLRGLDLRGKGIQRAESIARSNVNGAKLPEDIRDFGDVLDHVAEASKNSRKLFLGMLGACLYCILTIATTTDVRLLTNSASSPLPIIGTEIPIAGFYIAAPLLLFAVCMYFHLYLQRLWEDLSVLPAVFQDGRPLDKKAYPWLLSGLVRAHIGQLRRKRPALSQTQAGLSILLAWWAVPGTLVLFWVRYLPRHDWLGTLLHAVLLTASFYTAIMLRDLSMRMRHSRFEFSEQSLAASPPRSA